MSDNNKKHDRDNLKKDLKLAARQQIDSLEEKSAYLEDKAAAMLNILEDLEEARDQAAANEAYLVSVLNTAPTGIVVLTDRIIRDVNTQYCEILGYTREELIGQSIRMVYLSEQEYQQVGDAIYSQMRQSGRGTAETRMITKKGDVRDILVIGMPIDPNDWGKGVTFAILDITNRKMAEQKLSQRLKLEHLLADISAGFIGMPIEKTFERITHSLEMMSRELGFERLRLCLLTEDGTRFYLSDTCFLLYNESSLFDTDDVDRDLPELARMLRDRQVVWLSDLPDDLPEKSTLRDFSVERGIISHVSIPMMVGNQHLGALLITHTHNRIQFDQDLLNYLQLIADILANAILRQRNQQALADSERRFRSVIEASPMGFNAYTLQSDGQLILSMTNHAAESILQRDLTSQIGKPLEELFPEIARSNLPELYKKIAEYGGACHMNNFDLPEDQRPCGRYHDIYVFQTSPNKIAAMFMDVTEQICVQRSLEFTQYATDHAVEGAFWIREDGKMVYVNEAACRMLGYTHDELLDMTIPDLDPNFPRDGWAEHWEKSKKSGKSRFETQHLAKDGRLIPVEITSNFVEYEGQEYHCSFSRDITQRKQSEEALRESEYKHRLLFTSANDAIFIMDEKHYLECNPRAVELFGCDSAEQLLNRSPSDFSPEYQEDGQRSDEKNRELLANALAGELLRSPWVHCRPNGEKFYVEMSLSRLELKGRMMVQVVLRDVTEQKKSEKKLQEASEALRANQWLTQMAINNIPQFIFWKDRQSVYRGCNINFARAAGLKDPSEIVGKTDFDLVWKHEEAEFFRIVDRRVMDNKRAEYNIIEPRLQANGKQAWLETNKIPMLNEQGDVIGILGTYEDITEKRKARQALQESENKHRLLFTSANDAIFIMDQQTFLECNPRAIELYGCSRAEQLLGHSPVEFSPEYQEDGRRSDEKAKGFLEKALDGQSQRFPWVHCKLNGELFHVEVSLNRLELKGQSVVQAMVRDVTEQRVAEKAREKLLNELRSKNEELESIVFIASHDLRSPLVNIRGFSGELEKSLERLQALLEGERLSKETDKELEYLFQTDIPESLSFIIAGNRKMDVLLNGLLKLSRIGAAQITTSRLDMNKIFREIIDGFRFIIQEGQVQVLVDPSVPDCYGDRVLVAQVFSNLIDNAIKYHHPDRTPEIHISAQVRESSVIYCVSDNGIGIAREHINKVFEIFHQLAPDAAIPGEGLGLTIVRRILARQDGRIWMESEVGVGTKVFVQLPLA